jgi:hypothetical protein
MSIVTKLGSKKPKNGKIKRPKKRSFRNCKRRNINMQKFIGYINPNIAYLNSTLFKQIEGLEGFSI